MLSHASCQSNPPQESTSSVPKMQVVADSLWLSWPYDLVRPAKKMSLPEELIEVSALSYYADGELVMVNDELGKYYIFDLDQEEISRKVSFALDGDFEGVERVNDQLYILRSDGFIFRVDDPEAEEPEMNSFRTFLSDNDDTEGLGYDPTTGQLLIACKEPARNMDRDDRYRAVYALNLDTKELAEEPLLTLDLAEVKAFLMASAQTEDEKEEAEEFEVKKEKSFKPSAIAVHPISGHYYLMASAGKLLLVLNRSGRVIGAAHLPRKRFSQPEGICFSPEGDLYISNEGRDGAASLLWFRYQPNP